VPYRLGSQKD
jgi:hypothetical protein